MKNQLIAAIAAVFLAANANAVLLTPTAELQIEGWLGQGDVTFNKIFAKVSGSTSADFHAAADGKGATISILSVLDQHGHTHVIGGYNPQSWSSVGGYNLSPDPNNIGTSRNAFLFNTTQNFVQYQQIFGSYYYYYGYQDTGYYQTYNGSNNGPTFGQYGFDLNVGSALDVFSAYSWSYGRPNHARDILGDGGTRSLNDYVLSGSSGSVINLEVYTISSSSVPDGGLTLALLGLALAGVAGLRRTLRTPRLAALLPSIR